MLLGYLENNVYFHELFIRKIGHYFPNNVIHLFKIYACLSVNLHLS